MGQKYLRWTGSRLGGLIGAVLFLTALLLSLYASAAFSGRWEGIAVYEFEGTPDLAEEAASQAHAVEICAAERTSAYFSSETRSVNGVLYRGSVTGNHGLSGILPVSFSDQNGVYLSGAMLRDLFGGSEAAMDESIRIDGTDFRTAGSFQYAEGMDAWLTSEDRCAWVNGTPESGKLLLAVRFPESVPSGEDYRLRQILGSSMTGYAPLYLWAEWMHRISLLLLWCLFICLLSSLPSLLPLIPSEKLRSASKFMLLFGSIFFGVLLFPGLPVPQEVIPERLIHLSEWVQNLKAYCRMRTALPVPLLPISTKAALLIRFVPAAALITGIAGIILANPRLRVYND